MNCMRCKRAIVVGDLVTVVSGVTDIPDPYSPAFQVFTVFMGYNHSDCNDTVTEPNPA